MGKIYILLTVSAYLPLLSPYSYSAAPICIAPAHMHISAEVYSATNELAASLRSLFYLIQEGDKYYDQNDYDTAITYYQQAMQQYFRNNKNTVLILAQIFNNIGMCYLDMKAYQHTFIYYNKALVIRQLALKEAKISYNATICKVISEHVGKSHHNLGLFYLDIHNPKLAIKAFKAALETEWQHHIEATDTRYFLAWAYMQEKCYSKSKILYESILAKQATKSYLSHKETKNIEKYLQQISEKIQARPAGKVQPPIMNKSTSSRVDRALAHPLEVKKGSSKCPKGVQKVRQKATQGRHHLTHTTNARFFCNRCHLSFSYKRYYLSHMQGHTVRKHFACPICHKKFSLQHEMQTHMRVHMGEKSFGCTFCYRQFAEKHKMQKHIMTMHKKPIPIPGNYIG